MNVSHYIGFDVHKKHITFCIKPGCPILCGFQRMGISGARQVFCSFGDNSQDTRLRSKAPTVESCASHPFQNRERMGQPVLRRG